MDFRRLAEALPSSVCIVGQHQLLKSIWGLQAWKTWAANHKLPVFPVEAVHIALYLQHLVETKCSISAVVEAVNGLAWEYSMAGIPSPIGSPIVQTILEGLKRTLAKLANKKLAVTLEMLRAMVQDAKKSDALPSIWLASVSLLSFAWFLSFDELKNIRPCGLEIGKDHLTIHIPQINCGKAAS